MFLFCTRGIVASFFRQKTETQSIGRKMDMLNADLLLKNEATAKKGKKRTADEDESEGGFHFIAFMPIEDQLWKLDGLERQPMCLGKRQVCSGRIDNADEILPQAQYKATGSVKQSPISRLVWPSMKRVRSSLPF